MTAQALTTIRLVNGSIGDPVLYLDYPGATNAILFDAGDNAALSLKELGDLECVFITHHHVDHFIGLDRIIRANIDQDKVLHLFGPPGTIQKAYDRIKSYEYSFFPFQMIRVKITELHAGFVRSGLLECTKKFPEPTLVDEPWAGGVCYQTPHFSVQAVPVEHTVPCFAYALTESSGYHPDPAKIARGSLRPGGWIAEVLNQLRSGTSLDSRLSVGGGSYTLGGLAEEFFTQTTGAKIVFITDTLYSEAVQPSLVKLAKGATRLYCDSFYLKTHLKQALKHKHMIASHAAELAKAAKVEQLELIHFSQRYQGDYQPLIDEAAAIFPRVHATLAPLPHPGEF